MVGGRGREGTTTPTHNHIIWLVLSPLVFIFPPTTVKFVYWIPWAFYSWRLQHTTTHVRSGSRASNWLLSIIKKLWGYFHIPQDKSVTYQSSTAYTSIMIYNIGHEHCNVIWLTADFLLLRPKSWTIGVTRCLPISMYFGSKGVPIELQRTSTYCREITVSLILHFFCKLVSCTRLSVKAYLIANISHYLTLNSNRKQEDHGCRKYKDVQAW